MGRSPSRPGGLNTTGLPSSSIQQTNTYFNSNMSRSESTLRTRRDPPTNPAGGKSIKRKAGKEHMYPSHPPYTKRARLSLPSAHVRDHSITAMEVSAQTLADGIDMTQADQDLSY